MSEDSRSRHDDGKLLYCSFCGKSQHEVRKLIAGPSVFVCDECVELCNDIIREELEDRAERARDKLPKPHEIKKVLDFVGLGELVARAFGAVLELLTDDVVAQLDAFVAHEHRGAGDQFADLVLTLPAEGAVQELAVIMTAAGVFTHRGLS